MTGALQNLSLSFRSTPFCRQRLGRRGGGKLTAGCRELQEAVCLPSRGPYGPYAGTIDSDFASPGLGQWFSTGKNAAYCGTKLGFCVKEGNYKLQTIIDNATKIMVMYGGKPANWALLEYQVQSLQYKHGLSSEQAHELTAQIYI